jgi:hypothetical protein
VSETPNVELAILIFEELKMGYETVDPRRLLKAKLLL